jgi:hypothetical protein
MRTEQVSPARSPPARCRATHRRAPGRRRSCCRCPSSSRSDTSRATIAKRFAELEAAAEREILVCTKPPHAVEPAQNAAGLELLGRGVEARSVYERSVYDDRAVVEAVGSFVTAGEQARIIDELPLKLALIDERFALFTLEDPVAGGTNLTIMIVEHPAVARLLELAFEQVWERGDAFR